MDSEGVRFILRLLYPEEQHINKTHEKKWSDGRKTENKENERWS